MPRAWQLVASCCAKQGPTHRYNLQVCQECAENVQKNLQAIHSPLNVIHFLATPPPRFPPHQHKLCTLIPTHTSLIGCMSLPNKQATESCQHKRACIRLCPFDYHPHHNIGTRRQPSRCTPIRQPKGPRATSLIVRQPSAVPAVAQLSSCRGCDKQAHAAGWCGAPICHFDVKLCHGCAGLTPAAGLLDLEGVCVTGSEEEAGL